MRLKIKLDKFCSVNNINYMITKCNFVTKYLYELSFSKECHKNLYTNVMLLLSIYIKNMFIYFNKKITTIKL